MLKAEKCTKATAGPAAQRCVNVSAWTLHLHQECAATVQLLSWRDLERLCAITLKTSHILVRLHYVIFLYRGLEFTWENIILIYLQLWEKITEECWPKFKVLAMICSIFPWNWSGWGGVNSVLASLASAALCLGSQKGVDSSPVFWLLLLSSADPAPGLPPHLSAGAGLERPDSRDSWLQGYSPPQDICSAADAKRK